MELPLDETEDLDESSTVKLKLPKHQHLQLHCLKIMTGQTMSDIATEAFSQYFEEIGLNEEVG